MEKKSGKHLYYWGLAGLFPGIGLGIAISLIYRGLFKYKNKTLTIIGIIAMFPTMSVFGFLYYTAHFAEDLPAEMNLISLGVVVKDLEKYKYYNKTYPDSLEQLRSIDKYVPINDIFLSRRQLDEPKVTKVKFNYFKKEESYQLFSSGFDMIPNTKDDLYPSNLK